jgi:GAF domain-containing protein
MAADGELLGVLNVYSKGAPRAFREDERELAMIYANQIAAALENARLFGQVRQRSRHWEALHTSAKAITAGISADRRPVLDRIVEEAVECIGTLTGPRPISGILQLYSLKTNELAFENVYPPGLWSALRAQVGDSRLLDREAVRGGRIGITGRAVLEGRAQRVDEVHLDPDYLEVNAATASELAAPLRDGDTILGVLSLESEMPAAFDESDELTLCALADLAVIAIKNSEAAGNLSQASAVAMLGAWGADVMHDINREIGHIRRAVYILKDDPRLAQQDDLCRYLDQIDARASEMAIYALPDEPAPPGASISPLYTARVDVVVNDQVRAHRESHASVTWLADLHCEGVSVAMHEQWLSRLLRHLMRNALTALAGQPQPIVKVRTVLSPPSVEIEVEDNGKGIRPEIQQLLFHQPIAHKGGLPGYGLLLASFIARQHGAQVDLKWSKLGEGACFRITAPAAFVRPATPEPQ